MKRALLLAVMINVIAPAAAAPDIDIEPIFVIATERQNGGAYERVVAIAAPYVGGGHVGLLLNRPTEVTLSALFPEFAPARKVVDPVYRGGPIMAGAVFALVKADAQPSARSTPMSPGVWFVEDAPTIDKIIEATPNQARYFVGQLHWLPGALRDVIDRGVILAKPADPAKIFLHDTSKLYEDLAPAQLPPGGRSVRRDDVDLAVLRADLRHALRRGRETFLEVHRAREF